MVALPVYEKPVPFSEYQRLQTAYQKEQAAHQELRSEHFRILKEKDQKIHNLEKRLRLREDLDSVSAKVMSQNQKAAQYAVIKAIETTEPTAQGRVLLPNTEDLAKSAGMSAQTFQKALSHNDKIGSIRKETLPVRDNDGKILYTETYVRPTILTFTPRAYTTEAPRNHGGERLFCEGCGSDKIEKEITYVCKGCGKRHDHKPNGNPPEDNQPVEPVEPETQFASTVNSDDCEEKTADNAVSPESSSTIVGNPESPETQFASTVKIDRKRNLTLLSNNYLQSQLDSTVESTEEESNKTHTDASASPDHATIIKDWLNIHRGSDPIITATGKLDARGKYLYQEQGYQPDLDAYIAGDINHIYGSRLLNPETGLTQVLCYEIDKAEHDAQVENWMLDLARAGAAPVYEQRYAKARQRGHLKFYFDRPVDPEVARQCVIEICPDLADVPEVFPCKVPQDKRKQALSWPLYQRIGDTVYPCNAIYMLPAPHDGGLQECDPTDLEALAGLITDAVTPAALVEEFSTVLAEREALQPSENAGNVLFIGKEPKPITQVQSDSDLIPQVLADFEHDWDNLASMAGGWHKGFFRAIWRGEKTASVRPDKDGRYACDYGNHGNFPKKLDRYGAYCLIQGIDQTTDLAERCAELRRQQNVTTSGTVVPIAGTTVVTTNVTTSTNVVPEPATGLFPTEQKPVAPVYTPCICCGKPKSIERADGALVCGTDHSKE